MHAKRVIKWFWVYQFEWFYVFLGMHVDFFSTERQSISHRHSMSLQIIKADFMGFNQWGKMIFCVHVQFEVSILLYGSVTAEIISKTYDAFSISKNDKELNWRTPSVNYKKMQKCD